MTLHKMMKPQECNQAKLMNLMTSQEWPTTTFLIQFIVHQIQLIANQSSKRPWWRERCRLRTKTQNTWRPQRSETKRLQPPFPTYGGERHFNGSPILLTCKSHVWGRWSHHVSPRRYTIHSWQSYQTMGWQKCWSSRHRAVTTTRPRGGWTHDAKRIDSTSKTSDTQIRDVPEGEKDRKNQ